MKLSLVIPCYNEGSGLPALLKRLKAVSIEQPDIEFVLVDNGSSDATVELVKNAPENNAAIHPVRVEVNQGYGYGILQGLKAASGEYLGWTHADMQTDPADALRAMKIIDRYPSFVGNLFIKGRRHARPLGDKFFTWGMGIVESLLFQRPFLCMISMLNQIFSRVSFMSFGKTPPMIFLWIYMPMQWPYGRVLK